VVFTGIVSDEMLVRLTQCARVAFFPSLSEGFGMPIAEAVACGAPAICSRTTAMPEVIGWDPGMFDPTDANDMARVLAAALDDEAFRSDLLAACERARPLLTWNAVAHRTLDALKEHVVPNLSPNRPPRRTVAVIGPDTPTRHGLIAGLLAVGAEVDVFDHHVTSADVAHHPVESLGRTADPAGYEHRVYVLDDTAASAAAYTLAQRFPGVLVLTTDRLTTAACAATVDSIGPLLRATYTALPSAIEKMSEPTLMALTERDIRFIAPVGRCAHRIVALSDAAARAAEFDIGPWHRCPPIDIVDDAHQIASLLWPAHA
jgi:Glycosyl transferases group 1